MLYNLSLSKVSKNLMTLFHRFWIYEILGFHSIDYWDYDYSLNLLQALLFPMPVLISHTFSGSLVILSFDAI
jgi:hypothetical protein